MQQLQQSIYLPHQRNSLSFPPSPEHYGNCTNVGCFIKLLLYQACISWSLFCIKPSTDEACAVSTFSTRTLLWKHLEMHLKFLCDYLPHAGGPDFDPHQLQIVRALKAHPHPLWALRLSTQNKRTVVKNEIRKKIEWANRRENNRCGWVGAFGYRWLSRWALSTGDNAEDLSTWVQRLSKNIGEPKHLASLTKYKLHAGPLWNLNL
jgi:hypothetical protein